MARKSYWDQTYYPQPSESEIRSNAAQTVRKAANKGQTLSPVILTGRVIAKSWWGKAWCQNLEQYADFETRLPRGQKYVRSGAVVDLQIQIDCGVFYFRICFFVFYGSFRQCDFCIQRGVLNVRGGKSKFR